MRSLIIVALGALALSGCTGTHIKAPAVCDGKHRRPANIYGSVLPTLPVPLPPSQASGQSVVNPQSDGAEPAAAPAPPAPPPRAGSDQPAGAGGQPGKPSDGVDNSVPPQPKTSQRDLARSYFSC